MMELPVSSKRHAAKGEKSGVDSHLLREISSRLAIYRKLKELGHSDETIIAVYNKRTYREN